MHNISVILDGGNKGKLLNKMLTEFATEFNAQSENNSVNIKEISEEDITKISDVLSRMILSEYERKILVKVINKKCEEYTKRDKLEIWKIAMTQLLRDKHSSNSDYLLRYAIVNKEVEDCLRSSDIFNVEGFVNFRLGEYAKELEDVVEWSLSEYSVELEYREFISMMRYFLSMQSSRYLSVEIKYYDKVSITADGKDITDECRQEYVNYAEAGFESIEDFMLNSLIYIAPKRVTLRYGEHAPQKELLDTLKGVFGDKIKIINENKITEKDMQ